MASLLRHLAARLRPFDAAPRSVCQQEPPRVAGGRTSDAVGLALAMALSALTISSLVAARPAHAAIGGLPELVGKLDPSPNWDALRPKLFGDRAVFLPPSQVRIDVPRRAAFGSAVPVKVSLQFPQDPVLYVKRLYLIVDNNPSPVAATIDVSPGVGRADFETRVRVDRYSHVRVVAELSDGQLHMDAAYIKTSGGCSAPPNRERPEEIGRIMLRVAAGTAASRPDEPTTVDFSIRHPNDTGFELNHQTVMFIPPHFVREVDIRYRGEALWRADLDFSISENPYFRFNLVPGEGGDLRADVVDSKGGSFSRTIAVKVTD